MSIFADTIESRPITMDQPFHFYADAVEETKCTTEYNVNKNIGAYADDGLYYGENIEILEMSYNDS